MTTDFSEVKAKFPELANMDVKRLQELRKEMGCVKTVLNYDLHRYCKEREVAEVEELLEQGADPNLQDTRPRQMNRTPMHNVFSRKMKSPGDRAYAERIVELLIEWGADVNRTCRNGETLLEMAIERECLRAAQMIVKAGGKITEKCFRNAAMNGHPEILDWMIESDEFDDEKILKYSVRFGRVNNVKQLLEKIKGDLPENTYAYALTTYHAELENMFRVLMEDGRADPTVYQYDVFCNLLKRTVDSNGRHEKTIKIFQELAKDPRVNLGDPKIGFLNKFLIDSSIYYYSSTFTPDQLEILLKTDPRIVESLKKNQEIVPSWLRRTFNYDSVYKNRQYVCEPIRPNFETFRILVENGAPVGGRIKYNQFGELGVRDSLKQCNFPQEWVDVLDKHENRNENLWINLIEKEEM